ncbi:MAG: hypothetical protein SA378_02365 [Sedimentibacter sp.]|uniref:hypothetical protein n=1 Tax=Sedimentibacter sp. TaxID=1960295 RepID=UPI002980D5A0|nr:hypothetical protein [Sedimentibacter sp.]MDW5298973.1 hypothetical protein [Sedimentibacter sp.]
MRMIFMIVSTIGLLLLFARKRKFDIFSVAYVSACIYFIPGYFGFVRYPLIQRQIPIHNLTYIVMILVLISLMVFSYLYDKSSNKSVINLVIKDSNFTSGIVFILAIIGFIMMIATSGAVIFSPDRAEMAGSLNRWYTLMRVSASVCAVISYNEGSRKKTLLSMIILLFDVYLGSRTTFAITVVAIILSHYSTKEKMRFLHNNIKKILLISTFGVFMFAYKHIYIYVKMFDWNRIYKEITSLDFYYRAFTFSEPFNTQAILNKVITEDYFIGLSQFKSIIYQAVLFAPSFGAEIRSFNSFFQNDLFGNVSWGMADNIWAQMYSGGRWGLLIIFIVMFNIYILVLSKLIRFKDPTIKGLASLLSLYWVFYIHRNDLSYQINLQKRVILIYLVALLISIIINGTIVKKRRLKQES